MDPSLRLISLSVAMLVGSYISGSVPLAISLSEKNMQAVSIVGAGLIVGTALAVIIPEGVHALYEQQHEEHHHDHSGHIHRKLAEIAVKPADVVADVNAAGDSGKYFENLHAKLTPEVELHTMIGISLSLGFVFMLLIDQCFSGGHSHAVEGDSSTGNNRGRKSVTATLGLLVHAAADGIALGAAATTSRTDVEMIVFIAIMLHKAPAAFGLTTYLLHENYDRNRIRRHILAFSVAAPTTALLTYYGLSQTGKEALSSVNGTGLVMLFSAGTFLYVATIHILPEVSQRSHGPDLAAGEGGHSHSNLSRKELLLLILGIVTPIVLGMFHKH